MNTLPLKLSHEANQSEAELKRLFDVMWQMLQSRAADVNVYGAPHLGSRDLLLKYLVSQNLTNFNAEALEADKARYLTQAWRYRNPKRGTHFLRTFITMLWGTDFEIAQLWQKKSGVYPQDLKTEAEIKEISGSLNDYFLTSRLRVVLHGKQGYFPSDLARSLNKLLPARLFVHDIQQQTIYETQILWAEHTDVTSTLDTDSQTIMEIVEAAPQIAIAADTVIFSSTITNTNR